MGLALAACSGGGGGGEAGVTYTGVTTQASVTDANAVELTTTAYQGGNSGGSFALIGVTTDAAEGAGGATAQAMAVTRVLEDAVRAARFSPNTSDQVAVGATQSMSGQLDPGNCGGTASFSGTADDVTGEFHATFTFSAWCNDGVTVSGRVTASGQIDVSTEQMVELEFSFSVLTVSDGTDTFRGSGTITVSFGTSESMTVTMDFASGDGTTYRVSNLQMTASPTASGESVTVTGRVYHPIHGYVDVSTPVALEIETGQTFPSSGELLVTGATGSKAKLTASSPSEFRIDVDADGDDLYETNLGPFTWESV
jgi:hypothetical protein